MIKMDNKTLNILASSFLIATLLISINFLSFIEKTYGSTIIGPDGSVTTYEPPETTTPHYNIDAEIIAPTAPGDKGNQSNNQVITEADLAAADEITYVYEDNGHKDYVKTYKIYEDGDNYYCYDNGSLVRSAWRKISKYSYSQYAPTEAYDDDYIWAYFSSTGRAIKASSGSIKKMQIGDATYAFNEYGQLLLGFFNDSGEMFYYGGYDDPFELLDKDNYLYYADKKTGALVSGFHTMDEISEKYENKDKITLYFSPSNFRSVRSTSNTAKTQTINGKSYAFDNNGVLLTRFDAYEYNLENGGNTNSIKYYADDGSLIKNGFVEVNTENYDIDLSRYDDDITIYLNKSGNMYKNMIKKIGSNSYGFDKYGVLIKGLSVWENGSYVATIDTDNTNGRNYIRTGSYKDKTNTTRTYNPNTQNLHYFDSSGKRITTTAYIEFADDTYTYNASNVGGFDGIHDKRYYVRGLMIKPTNYKYGIYVQNLSKANYNWNEIAGKGNAYLLQKTGAKVTNKTAVKDDSDYYWQLGTDNTIINVYSVATKYSNGKYYFKSRTVKGSTTWIEFGEKDAYNKTCVLNVTANGTKLKNGAISSYQIKPNRGYALNFSMN